MSADLAQALYPVLSLMVSFCCCCLRQRKYGIEDKGESSDALRLAHWCRHVGAAEHIVQRASVDVHLPSGFAVERVVPAHQISL